MANAAFDEKSGAERSRLVIRPSLADENASLILHRRLADSLVHDRKKLQRRHVVEMRDAVEHGSNNVQSSQYLVVPCNVRGFIIDSANAPLLFSCLLSYS